MSENPDSHLHIRIVCKQCQEGPDDPNCPRCQEIWEKEGPGIVENFNELASIIAEINGLPPARLEYTGIRSNDAPSNPETPSSGKGK